jgi:choline dehydrogenase-like flavoprotein
LIVDLAKTPWPESASVADIVVVGAGAAGITIARELANSRLRIVVLEAGAASVATFGDDDALVSGFGARTFGEGRGRGLGGTTAMWAGQVLRLEPFDFTVRPWVPLSGWPIDHELLEPFYRRAEALLGLPAAPDAPNGWSSGLLAPMLGDDLLVRHSQFASQPDMAALYASDLARATNVTVLLRAPATKVYLNGAMRLRSVEVALPDLTGRAVETRFAVLSSGAVESARLLLESAASCDPGRWPHSPLVGRCFQDHAHIGLALRGPHQRTVATALNSRLLDGRRVFPKLVATSALQRRHELLSLGSDIGYVSAAGSPVRAAATLMRAARDRSARREVPRALLDVTTQPVAVARALHGRLRHGYKLSEGDGRAHVGIQVETAPNPESRITLSKQCDAAGRPRAEVRWCVEEPERRSARIFAGVLGRAFAVAGLGVIDDELPDLDDDPGWIARINPGHHHLGTLRMANDPSRGVVDRDCQAHGIRGLFVAGGAVFPTGGFGNPTLTILALALRLADHLRVTVIR